MENELKTYRSSIVEFFKKLNQEEKFVIFCHAILQYNTDMCEILLESGFDINFHSNAKTVFSVYGHEETILTLLTKERKDFTLEMAEWLLEHGADINAHNICEEYTPLYIACIWNDYELVKLYLAHGAKVTNTTIRIALEKAKIRIEILEEQLKVASKEVLANFSEDWDWDRFYSDRSVEKFQKKELLFKYGVQVRYWFRYLKTFVRDRNLEFAKYLLENHLESININEEIMYEHLDNEVYVCDIAVNNKDVEMIKLLKKYGAYESTKKQKIEKLQRRLETATSEEMKTLNKKILDLALQEE